EEEPQHQDQHRAEHVDLERGHQRADDHDQQRADADDPERDVAVGPQGAAGARAAQRLHAPHGAADDGRQRLEERDDAAGRHRSRSDIQNVILPDLGRVHLADELGGGIDRGGGGPAEQLDGGHQHQAGEDAARAHDHGDAGADDVADAHQLRADLDGEVAAVVGLAEDPLGHVLEEPERLVAESEDAADAEAGEDRLRGGAAGLAGDEDLGASGPLGVDERLRFLDDQRPAQRDHHENPEQAAEDAHQDHLGDLQVVAEDQQRRHGDAHAEGDALAGAAGRLGDVVLEDGGAAGAEDPGEAAEDGEGEDR